MPQKLGACQAKKGRKKREQKAEKTLTATTTYVIGGLGMIEKRATTLQPNNFAARCHASRQRTADHSDPTHAQTTLTQALGVGSRSCTRLAAIIYPRTPPAEVGGSEDRSSPGAAYNVAAGLRPRKTASTKGSTRGLNGGWPAQARPGGVRPLPILPTSALSVAT